jgi:hypothetical protein
VNNNNPNHANNWNWLKVNKPNSSENVQFGADNNQRGIWAEGSDRDFTIANKGINGLGVDLNGYTTIYNGLTLKNNNSANNWNWLKVDKPNSSEILYFGGDNTQRGIWATGSDRDFIIANNNNNALSINKDGNTTINKTLTVNNDINIMQDNVLIGIQPII